MLAMKNIQSAGLFGWSFLFLSSLLLLLFIPFPVHTQNTSNTIELEGTQWKGKPLSQGNIDGSLTVLTTTYTFEKQGKVTLLTVISKGVGMATIGTPFGDIPYATARTLSGTYKTNGNSVYIDFPDRAMDATISGDVMKGVIINKKNNHRSDWIAGRTLNSESSSLSDKPKPSQPTTDASRSKRVENALNSYYDGDKLYGTGKYDEAIAKYSEAINLLYDLPVRFQIYSYRGRAKIKLQDYKGAIEDFDVCIQNVEGKVEAKRYLEDSYEWRGHAKLAMNDYKGALADYNQFFQLFEKPYEPEQGVDLMDFLQSRDERKAEVYKARGTAKYKLNNKSGACEDFRESCKLGNSFACETVKIVCN
jgi:tetratricopeptide (TPR) repeat protein